MVGEPSTLKLYLNLYQASSSDPVSINAQAIFLSLLSQNPAAVYRALPLVGGGERALFGVGSFSLKALDYIWRELKTEVSLERRQKHLEPTRRDCDFASPPSYK